MRTYSKRPNKCKTKHQKDDYEIVVKLGLRIYKARQRDPAL